MPILTLLFRNYFVVAAAEELFKAARVDGAGFWHDLPRDHAADVDCRSSSVAMILQITGIWNDFLFGRGLRRAGIICR